MMRRGFHGANGAARLARFDLSAKAVSLKGTTALHHTQSGFIPEALGRYPLRAVSWCARTLGPRLRRRILLIGSLFGSAVAFSPSASAYRTAADSPEFEGAQKVRWAKDAVEYVLNTDVPVGVTYDDFAAAAHRAFEEWMQPNCSVLRFRSAGATSTPAARGDGVNTIQWITDQWSERGFATDAAAVTDVQYAQQLEGTWVIAEADLYLNAELYDWVPEPAASDQQSLLNVLTHEAGHIAGLLHPCEPGGTGGVPDCASSPGFAETTMYPFYGPEQTTLSADDVNGICFLYSGSRCASEGCRPGYRCTSDGCRIECGETVCGEGETCLDGGCRTTSPPCEGTSCDKACTSNDDCPLPLRCAGTTCAPGSGATADSCTSGRECAGGVCSSSGACMSVCFTDADCADGVSCVQNAGIPTCGSDGKPLGATCDSANDCAGGYCVADLSASPVCSRSCGAASVCPGGWNCADVQGNPVCAPAQSEDTGCACAAPGARWPYGTGSVLLAFTSCLLVRRILRRVRNLSVC
jgi:hypothetical protein